MSKKPDSFLGWLGRQVGFVHKAVKTDVTKPPSPPPPSPPPPSPVQPDVVYRADSVEEAPHPVEPGLKLRRTTIDEVIAQPPPPRDASNDQQK